jgi:aspartyl/asparaginyl beta-hydroxylase (cupin superfamily)
MKVWFSITSKDHVYQGTESEFVEVCHEDWAQSLLHHYDEIKAELNNYLCTHQMVPYFHQSMVSKKDKWKTIGLKFWEIEMPKHMVHFPKTKNWLKQHRNVVSCSFSQLDANSRILPHAGDTNGIYRVHLGFEVPEGLPRCGFRVRDQRRSWKEKELFGFLDAYNHEAWNESERTRIIMLIDVIRPEFIRKRSYICNQVIAALALQKLAAALLLNFHKPNGKQKPIPYWLRILMAKSMLAGVYAISPVVKLYQKAINRN